MTLNSRKLDNEEALRLARQEIALQRHCIAWLSTQAGSPGRDAAESSRAHPEHAGLATWRFDDAGQTIAASSALCTLLEVPAEPVLFNRTIDSLLTERSLQQLRRVLQTAKDATPVTVEVEVIGQISGRRSHVALSLMAVGGTSAARIYDAIAVNVTIRRNDDACARFLARDDSLTGLPNRAAFMERLHQAITIARRNNSMLALLCIDLLDFRPISDDHGTLAGDRLLCETANRLQGITRESDCVARLHGAEFALLATNLHEPAEAEVLTGKIARRLADPYALGGHQLNCQTGIGLALYPADGADAAALFEIAETSLQRARQAEQGGPANIRQARRMRRKSMFRPLPEPLRREELLRMSLQPEKEGPRTEAPRLSRTASNGAPATNRGRPLRAP